jgi:hypothetical protein
MLRPRMTGERGEMCRGKLDNYLSGTYSGGEVGK